jgi:hypothetical protein
MESQRRGARCYLCCALSKETLKPPESKGLDQYHPKPFNAWWLFTFDCRCNLQMSTLGRILALFKKSVYPFENNGHMMKRNKALTLHIYDDRLSYVCNKEQRTNNDTVYSSRFMRLCTHYICGAAHAPAGCYHYFFSNKTGPQQTFDSTKILQ